MNALNYFIEANVGIMVLYVVYHLLLSNETDFKIQRAYLLVGLFAAVLLPLIKIAGPIVVAETPAIAMILPELVLTPTGTMVPESGSAWSASTIILITYLTGMTIILLSMFVQGYRLFRVYVQSEKTRDGSQYIIESSSASSSYSFFNIVVLGQTEKLTAEERNMIILHEKYHGKLLHSVDVLIVSLATVVFWFNPVIWMYRRVILRIHEYQVDHAVSGESSSGEYSILLAKTVLMRNGFFLAHPFNQSFILKRINMINKLKTRISSLKLTVLMTTVIAFGVVVACTDVSQTEVPETGTENASLQERPSQVNARLSALKNRYPDASFEAIRIDGTKTESLWSQPGQSLEYLEKSELHGDWAIISKKKNEGEVLEIVQVSASPVNGISAFYEKISQVLVYPEQARIKGIEGKVFVQFTVQADGRLSDFKVARGIGAGCDASALNAVMQSDDWKPAENDGKVVAQQMVLPIIFKMN